MNFAAAAFYAPNSGGNCAYHIHNQAVATKQQAYDICESSGAHLAMPTTLAKQREIESVYQQFLSMDSTNVSFVVRLLVGVSRHGNGHAAQEEGLLTS